MIGDRPLRKVEKSRFREFSIMFKTKRKHIDQKISKVSTLIGLKVPFGMIFIMKGKIPKNIREMEVWVDLCVFQRNMLYCLQKYVWFAALI